MFQCRVPFRELISLVVSEESLFVMSLGEIGRQLDLVGSRVTCLGPK